MIVRVWQDHCIQRLRNPWTIQAISEDGRVLETAQAWIWQIHGAACPNNLAARGVAGLSRLTTEYTGVASVRLFAEAGDDQGRTIEA